MRTAVFSYCLAGPDGTFVLRIEDTDQARYDPDSVASITEALRWLGLQWDEGPEVGGPCAPYTESQRLPLYRTAAGRLVSSGAAYPCFCSPQRLEAVRTAQRAACQAPRYDGHCRELTPEAVAERRAAGTPEVVRMRIPAGETSWHDLVQGERRFENAVLDDQVLLKSDGFPTYHLAHVVDDHVMGITHVLRASEWLPSTPKHLILYAALGWEPPAFGHVPQVLGPDRGKLSKRHGAAPVQEYRDRGYLPEAVVNFLAFLGWSPGTEEEVFTLTELRARMTAERIQPSPAVFDTDRLDHLNGVWIRRLAADELAQRLQPWLPRADAAQRQAIAEMVRERIQRLDEVPALVAFAFEEPEPSAEALCGPLDPALAAAFLREVPQALPGDPADLVDRLRAAAERVGGTGAADRRHFKACMQVLRVAVTGQRVSPPLPESMALIGRERVLERLRRAEAALLA